MFNKSRKLGLVMLGGLMALPLSAVCQDSAMLFGKVVNKQTREGIPGLEVVILPGKDTLVTVTNEGGEYQLNNIPKGTYDVLFQDVNYGKKILKDVAFNSDTVRKNVHFLQKKYRLKRTICEFPHLPTRSVNRNLFFDDLTGNVKFEGDRLQRQLK